MIELNLVGTFNVLRLAAAGMAGNEPDDLGERGVCVQTASIAGIEGQIGQIAYGSAKAGVIGMTIIAARDLAAAGIRVCTIAPGTFDTPPMQGVPDAMRGAFAARVPLPKRLGEPAEFAALAQHMRREQLLNGELIRLDGRCASSRGERAIRSETVNSVAMPLCKWSVVGFVVSGRNAPSRSDRAAAAGPGTWSRPERSSSSGRHPV